MVQKQCGILQILADRPTTRTEVRSARSLRRSGAVFRRICVPQADGSQHRRGVPLRSVRRSSLLPDCQRRERSEGVRKKIATFGLSSCQMGFR
ncbi:hypothetical protein HNY73_011903 [Argiope bruennichi]|uniref:Uncharacterized protein n=1 Tax=Argiope bruennichi TaxID=94029 RepID=A0A8T0ET90_ARGBR|nr:hypothetical protein HNY73_011903 [Argiope bruennichi]